jgi:V/A-type H+-transporting ATPase subunit B
VADRLYAFYAQGQDLRRLVAIIGESALSPGDRRYLEFADEFERTFVHQGEQFRSVAETLDAAWRLLARFPEGELRIEPELVRRYAAGRP